MDPRFYTCSAFFLIFWLQKEGSRERVLLDLIGYCPDDVCGGKLHAVVCAGSIEGDRYLVKNPAVLYHDEEFPLQNSIICTNCGKEARTPESIVDAISKAAEEFIRSFKEARRAFKAQWN